MNLIASCPACQTSYRVVPDQLRISDGWVRCGQCGEIFDASQQLLDSDAKTSPAETPLSSSNLNETHPLNLEGLADDTQQENSPSTSQQGSSLPTTDIPLAQDLAARSSAEGSWASAALLIRPSIESEPDAGEPAETSSIPMAAPVSFLLEPDDLLGVRREGRPVLWWGLGVLLLFGLVLQGLYRERDQLAASFPAIKPALIDVCELIKCRVSPLHGIESLAIDSASFQQVGQDSFELRFVVKNKSRFELALPAIELTLTDLAEQPVMRRVFTLAELGAAPETVASAGEWSVTTYVQLRTNGTEARAQGYRLLIFYP